MDHNIAAVRGTTSLYVYLDGDKVLILRDGYQYRVVSTDTFHAMYTPLSLEYAALNEDCIEYVIFHPDKSLWEYPQWYNECIYHGWIVKEYYGWTLITIDGEMALPPGCVILKNKFGELKYLERNEFDKYYVIVGGLEDES